MVETYERLHEQITDRGPWQHTASGHAFFPGDPRPEEVDVRVIARALSRIGRYNGHWAEWVSHYSVAQHAAMIARWMLQDGHSIQRCYAGLHHDSAEAYIGDIISQMKRLCPQIKVVEKKVEAAVFEAMMVDMDPATHTLVKEYDFIALATEKRDLMPPNLSGHSWGALPEPRASRITPWSARAAEEDFLALHFNFIKNGATT